MTFTKKYSWLTPMFAFIGLLIVCRVIYAQSLAFLFLPWNLFLALLSLYFSYKLRNPPNSKTVWAFFGAWLLFFPNSMYIVTDLFHLWERPHIPLWYDLIILFSSATLGIILGFLSVRNVECFLLSRIKSRNVPLVMLSFFLLCGYGVYLGRYLRWNSWDIVAQPYALFSDMVQNIIHPFRNKECWLLTTLFGIWLYILYRYFKKLPLKEQAS